jgi:hypothetical protein
MEKRINLEDNIFIINTRIRMLRDLLILDTDPDMFLTKTLEDIEFIDTILRLLMENLVNNERLIDRNEQFYNLVETERQFAEILAELVHGDATISAARFPVIADKVMEFRAHSLERRNAAEDAITEPDSAAIEPLVSSDELNELLKIMD